jgi:hypothetical protein
MQFLISTRNLERAAYQPHLIITGGGKTNEVEPRARGESFIAEAGPFPPGTYRVVLKNNIGNPPELAQSIEVVTASLENRELSADPELMGRLAQVSGGEVVHDSDIPRLGAVVKRWEARRELSHRQQPIWDRWWMLTAMLGALAGEWWLRRQKGLL